MFLKNDKQGYEKEYKDQLSKLIECSNIQEYVENFKKQLQPFYLGGVTKGYVRGLAVKKIIQDCQSRGLSPEKITILDCGSGLGELSVYLSALGFNVIGVEISEEGVRAGEKLAKKFKLTNCRFVATSLEEIPLEDSSIDFLIGHAALHHFIKYKKIPDEFRRVMKLNAKGYFADSFGENKLYHLFHDKIKMKELGDVSLTKQLVTNYFVSFNILLLPTDWFVMLDKLYLKIIPNRAVRFLSKYHFKLDRWINPKSRINLFLSGSVLTEIQNNF